MAEKKKKKKGHYGKVLGFCAVVGCAAFLLSMLGGGGGFGFGLPWAGGNGNGNGNGSNGGGYEANGYQPSTDYETTNGENGYAYDENGNGAPVEPVLIIRVVGNDIYHGYEPITLDDLVPLLEEINQPGYVWELRDVQAIMETYDNVKVLMEENGISFTERSGV